MVVSILLTYTYFFCYYYIGSTLVYNIGGIGWGCKEENKPTNIEKGHTQNEKPLGILI